MLWSGNVNYATKFLSPRINVEIVSYIVKAAENHLKTEGATKLPAQLAGTDFFLAFSDDASVLAHASVSHEGVEYKIGVKVQ